MNDNSYREKWSAAAAGPEIGAGQLGDRKSLWEAAAPPFTDGSQATGELATEVAIVGGGVAGLSTALHLAALDIETLVLEAEIPGSAATGASGGLLAPELARGGIAKAARLHGLERGERLTRLVGRSAAYTRELISRHGIDCDLQEDGFVSPGKTAHEVETLQADARTWKSLGFAVEYLDEKETTEAIGTDVYKGALLFESGGAFNPLAYASGLAGAVHRAGVALFTNSPVQKVERMNGKWRLQLPQGSVSANRVVLAANGGNAGLHSSLANVALPLLVYEYATSPLSEGDRKRYFGAGLPYTDREPYLFTARLDKAGRLVSAIPETLPGWSRAGFVREASRRLDDVYSMPLESIEYAWEGTAYLNSSLLPAVYLPEEDMSLIAIQACNGRGLGINTILGGEVANLLAGADPKSLAVPLTRPKAIPMYHLARHVPKIIMSLAQARDRFRGPHRAGRTDISR